MQRLDGAEKWLRLQRKIFILMVMEINLHGRRIKVTPATKTEQQPMDKILGMFQQIIACQPDRLLSDKQVAEMIGVSRVQVWQLSKDEVLPSPCTIRRPGASKGLTRWKQSEITKYINSLPVAE